MARHQLSGSNDKNEIFEVIDSSDHGHYSISWVYWYWKVIRTIESYILLLDSLEIKYIQDLIILLQILV